MSLIIEYRTTEKAIKELKARLDSLGDNPALLKEMEFEEKLRTLMGEYGKSLRNIIMLLDPQPDMVATGVTSIRKPRAMKVYRHPESGEVIETKGANHIQLKAWKQQYGAIMVESWLQR
jgi:hypothetical protein